MTSQKLAPTPLGQYTTLLTALNSFKKKLRYVTSTLLVIPPPDNAVAICNTIEDEERVNRAYGVHAPSLVESNYRYTHEGRLQRVAIVPPRGKLRNWMSRVGAHRAALCWVVKKSSIPQGKAFRWIGTRIEVP